MVHSKHAEKGVVVFGNGAARPVFVQGADLKFFVAATKLHRCLLAKLSIAPINGGQSAAVESRWYPSQLLFSAQAVVRVF